jgi:GT2 family glycosyltransferase
VTDVSVLLTCLNAADTIGAQLDALASQTWQGSWEVVVADAGSSDDTVAVVETYRARLPELRIVDATGGSGIAHGLNVAAGAAQGDVLVICEADDEVAGGWLAAMVNSLERDELVASHGDVTKLNDPEVQASRVVIEGLQPSWFPPYLPHASTLGLGVRRELFERLGGFDENFKAMQDADFCFRAQLAGAQLVYARDAVVFYRFRSRPRDVYRQARLYAESFAQLQRKYKPRGSRVPGQWKWPLKNWRPIVGALVQVGRRGGMIRLAWAVGWQVGRLRGSLRHRVLAI